MMPRVRMSRVAIALVLGIAVYMQCPGEQRPLRIVFARGIPQLVAYRGESAKAWTVLAPTDGVYSVTDVAERFTVIAVCPQSFGADDVRVFHLARRWLDGSTQYRLIDPHTIPGWCWPVPRELAHIEWRWSSDPRVLPLDSTWPPNGVTFTSVWGLFQ